MADEAKIGAQDSLQEHSLQHYNESGVLATIRVFQQAERKFTNLSDKIYALETMLGAYWDGPAHKEFRERFRKVFCQVRDLGDAIGQIYDILMDVQLAFYKVDDSFGQQLKEAVHNSQGSSSSASQGGSGQKYDSKLESEFKPNLCYNPMPTKPVLVSTMGQAYIPDLSYVTMERRPSIGSCLPSILMLVLIYQNMDVRDQIAHTTDEALEFVLNLPAMNERPQLTSTIGEPVIADTSYPPMSEKPVLHSTMGEAYFPDLSYVTMNRRGVLKSIIGAAVVSSVLNAIIKGETREQAVTRIGEAVIAHLNGEYPAEVRDLIIQKLGEAIVNDLYGDGKGSASGAAADGTGRGGLSGIEDFSQWTTELQTLIDDAVSDSYKEWMFGEEIPSTVPSLYPPASSSNLSIVRNTDFNFAFRAQPVNTVVNFIGVGDLDGASVKLVAASAADYSNGQAVRQIVAQSVQQQSGRTLNVSMLSSTDQSVSQTSFVINITAPADHSVSLNALVQHSDTGASVNLQAVTDVTQQLCSQCAVGDFSNLTFPVRAA